MKRRLKSVKNLEPIAIEPTFLTEAKTAAWIKKYDEAMVCAVAALETVLRECVKNDIQPKDCDSFDEVVKFIGGILFNISELYSTRKMVLFGLPSEYKWLSRSVVYELLDEFAISGNSQFVLNSLNRLKKEH